MHYILLSGGSGKRLWPLSNDIRSKQFIRIFRTDNGDYESMVQRVYRQIGLADHSARVTIATSKSQVSTIRNQLGDNVNICVEPCRRDTFPAIALASAYLHDVQNVDEDEAVVVCPVDPYVEQDYFKTIQEMLTLAQTDDVNLVLMGIEPTYPSEKYGYIIPTDKSIVSRVDCFKEKPDTVVAERYIEQGALWNGGVFAFKLKQVLRIAHQLVHFNNYDDLLSKYETIQRISFDYAVVEKEKSISVIRYGGAWADLGTWNTFTGAMQDHTVGDVRMDAACKDVYVLNNLDVPVLCMGLKNVVVAASPEGVLVSDLEQSSYIKPFVDDIHQQVMFAEKSWGSFHVLDVEEDSLTIKIMLLPGHRLHYHSHEHRDETWTVVSGDGIAVVDDAEIAFRPGMMMRLPSGCRHTIIARTAMTIVEVQIGEDISVQDKQKFSLEKRYGKHGSYSN